MSVFFLIDLLLPLLFFSQEKSLQIPKHMSTDADKANRLDVANAINPLPKEEDKKLVIVKTPNAVNPLVWDYSVSV